MNYTTMDRIFSKLNRDINSSFSEDDIIEWTGEALEFMGTVKAYEEAVAFIEVKNHQVDIPHFTHSIIQIARNTKWTGINNCVTPTIVQASLDACVVKPGVADPCINPTSDAVWLDCNGQPIVEYDLAYYRPYFDYQLEYYGWSNSGCYQQNFVPVRLKTHSFFSSLVCTTQNNIPYNSCKDEYNIVDGSKIRFSFERGQVAVALTRQKMDKETGYPMIPDSISHITAITKYIALKIAERDFGNSRQGAESRVKYFGSEWDWYCGQASNNEKMPNGIDEYQNLLDQRGYLLPRNNKYFGFFGKLNQPEDRIWNGRGRNMVNSNRVKSGINQNEKIIINNENITGGSEGELLENEW